MVVKGIKEKITKVAKQVWKGRKSSNKSKGSKVKKLINLAKSKVKKLKKK